MDEYRLAVPLFRRLPGAEQEAQFLLPTDQRQRAADMLRLVAALEFALADRPPNLHRLSKALQPSGTKIPEPERVADKLVGKRFEYDLARRRKSFETGRKVRRLTGDRLDLRRSFTDQIADHDLPRRDAHARPKLRPANERHRRHAGNRIQSSAHGPFSLVFMRLRPAEIGKHPVTQELRDVTPVARHRPSHRVLVTPHHIAQVLGIEFPRQLGRSDQIAEHHRDLPALCIRGRPRLERTCRQRLIDWSFLFGGSGMEPGDCFEQFLAMPEEHAEALEVGLRQLRQHLEIDGVFIKNRRILCDP